jgi:hypothetical protein
MMEWLMDFLTERLEVFCPSLACPEVGIFRIKLEPIPFSQTIKHGVNHVVQLNKEPAVNAKMKDKSLVKGLV